MFPATLDVAGGTGLLYVANFDLHGGMKPGSISVVETESMSEVARVEVGIMPHGSRLNAAADRHYSVMMMSDELVETDAWGFGVRRRLPLGGQSGSHDHEAGAAMPMAGLKPTWVELAPGGRRLYVALNGANEIREIDLASWEVSRSFATAEGPYNIGVSADGRWLVVTCRADGSAGIWDLVEGIEVARIRTSRALAHGVAVSPDSRYAFVSAEGVGGESGTVDVLDLRSAALVATVEVGKQASGIAFWKQVAPAP
jgi:DNA-binding beta-propeller fold protein YncE